MSEPERDLLRSLPEQLRGVYAADTEGDPVRDRLFPRAYLDPTAEDAEREWRELVQPELVRERLEALALVTSSLDDASEGKRGNLVADLTADEVAAWLGVLNDARLALGTRLGVTEHTELAELDPDDPDTAGLAVYTWLTHLQGDLVETLLMDLPD
jgi:hypothetical protein